LQYVNPSMENVLTVTEWEDI